MTRRSLLYSVFLALSLAVPVGLSVALPAVAQPYPALSASELDGLAYRLDGVLAFSDLRSSQPLYFCRFVETPVSLPVESEKQLVFQKIEGVMGISRLSGSGLYQLRKLAVFQVVHRDGTVERRFTERVQRFVGPGLGPDGKFVLESDDKADGSTDERRTRVELDQATGKGSIRLSLWKGSKSDGPPYFEQTYHFAFQPIKSPTI